MKVAVFSAAVFVVAAPLLAGCSPSLPPASGYAMPPTSELYPYHRAHTAAAHRKARRQPVTIATERAILNERRATQWINPPAGAGE